MVIIMSLEVNPKFCICGSWRCTSGDAVGEIGCATFLLLGTLASLINWAKNCHCRRVDTAGTRLHVSALPKIILWLVFSGLMYLGTVNTFSMREEFFHPVQCDVAQWLGAVVLVIGGAAWVKVHWDLGRNWSPVPERLQNHELVTSGIFRFARHPMYAVFAWMSPAVALATFDWFRTVCYIAFVVIIAQRIPQEEAILVDLFGEQYEEYRLRVGALGPRCWIMARPPLASFDEVGA